MFYKNSFITQTKPMNWTMIMILNTMMISSMMMNKMNKKQKKSKILNKTKNLKW